MRFPSFDEPITQNREESILPNDMRDELLPLLSPEIRSWVQRLPLPILAQIEEIRLRIGRPVVVGAREGEYLADGWVVDANTLAFTIAQVSQHSLYAFEEEIRQGYITIPGGHRIGLVGKTLVEAGNVRTIKHISAVNIRRALQVKGAADAIIGRLLPGGKPLHTLILAPPQCGKTTLLRDLVRQVSNGRPEIGLRGYKVGLVDERSEIAGCYHGVPQKDVGLRTDVLDGCPKAQGMMMLIRAMSPEVVATDEIGNPEDVAAIEEIRNAGVVLFATAHGASLEECRQRPTMERLLKMNFFRRVVILGRSHGPGTVEGIEML